MGMVVDVNVVVVGGGVVVSWSRGGAGVGCGVWGVGVGCGVLVLPWGLVVATTALAC